MKKHATIMAALLCVLGLSVQAGSITTDGLTVKGDALFYGNLTLRTYAPPDSLPTNALSLHYAMNTNASPVPDDSGNGNVGTLNGAVWQNIGIGVGTPVGSYDFSTAASTANISVRMSNALHGATSMTVAAWVMISSDPNNWQNVIGTESDAGGEHGVPLRYLWFNVTGLGKQVCSALWIKRNSGGEEYALTTLAKQSTYFYDGVPHFVAMTWGGTSIMTYVDGVFDSSTATPAGSLICSNRNSLIGNSSSAGSIRERLNGSIDELRIYRTVLSTQDLQVLRQEGLARLNAFTVERISVSNSIVQTQITGTNVMMGSLGIGTNSPSASLHVNGDLKVEADAQIGGTLNVAGEAQFPGGIVYVKRSGDIGMGSYTNEP